MNSRREFIKKSTVGAAAFTIIPGHVMGSKFGYTSPSDKLNIAGIGVGGRGSGVLNYFKSENIVALCDVDWKYSENTFKRYPEAKKYYDYRKLFEEMGKSIDAVMVATADHTNAIITAEAIEMGKHVYVEKPLTHSVYETRLLTKLAKKHQIASQMGNQGASDEGVRKICETIWSGQIGEIKKVDAFTDRPIWPQGLETPQDIHKIPDKLNWDLFIGPAKFREYNSIYTPWGWRGWWDFGTGALGDMACHVLQPASQALNLGYPDMVIGSSTPLFVDSAPSAEKVKFYFPTRGKVGNIQMPEVEVNWYDGGLLPELPFGWPKDKSPIVTGGGAIFHGNKDTLICGGKGDQPWLLSGNELPKNSRLRKIDLNHGMDWVRACKENPASRVPAASDFSIAGSLNEMVVMGVIAVRLQGLNKHLEWDGEKMQFKNINDSETIKILTKNGFCIHEGHPTFTRKFTDAINAKQFARELIKHTYHNGYSLPEMPNI